MPVAEVKRFHLQELMDALRAEGREPATLQLEQAMYRGFFNYAARIWNWAEPRENPAAGLHMPKVENGRDRVMSAAEEARLAQAIDECRNGVVPHVVALLTESGMRASEPLLHARWGDVDWGRRVLTLGDAKTGRRDVPLSPKAIEALRALRGADERDADEPIVQLTYEALKAAWGRACERAGIADLRLQDLRHTAATRLALKTGNVLLVKALTGHKTMAMVHRYTNVKADDVVAVLHHDDPAPGAPEHEVSAGAAPKAAMLQPSREATCEDGPGALPSNVIRVAFDSKRSVA